ncbi:hypothetical protein [Dactylosporangium sp. CA-139066]|uniref:hypothetical protein n=1 Tax=Dactylosporangium sp. CA-139066 TaxID=3239930 RepID=UPI003D910BE7
MTTILRRALRWLGEFFDLVEPEPPRLNCGCLRNDRARFVCPCGHDACEQHRAHTCREAADAVR